jgi:hypothetical protein
MAGKATPPRPLGRRLLWFVGLWLAGVAAIAVVAGLLKLVAPA